VFLSLALYPPACSTFGILVNRYGQRFVNEDAYLSRLAHYAAQQDGQEIYLLVQDEDFELSPYLEPPRIAATGASIAEVEAESSLPANTLRHTVAYYNEHAARGEDPLFHKAAEWLKPIQTGPFALVSYAPADMKYHFGENPGYLMFTLGGLETAVTGEVLTPEGKPVPGLFAAGRTTAGLPRTAKGYASGMSVGDATFFGRLAGKRAASPTR
jgi:succinate dehydrogenase/fumarate reductase flavoprotein subunit